MAVMVWQKKTADYADVTDRNSKTKSRHAVKRDGFCENPVAAAL